MHSKTHPQTNYFKPNIILRLKSYLEKFVKWFISDEGIKSSLIQTESTEYIRQSS